MITGTIHDLVPTPGEVVQYHLELDGGRRLHLNPLIGQEIRLEPTGARACIWCGRRVTRLFANGSCFPCFRDLPQNDLCVVKPHTCHYETCRDQSWGDAHCMVPTYLYIARSSEIKVGISRNIPGRWMEQGAVEAMPIALLPTRKLAGELEFLISRHIPDKTNWRKMLKGELSETPLEEIRRRVISLIPEHLRCYVLPEQPEFRFEYPVAEALERFSGHDLEKGPAAGRLLGIKAKYLILSSGVLNLPKFAGHEVRIGWAAAGGASAAG